MDSRPTRTTVVLVPVCALCLAAHAGATPILTFSFDPTRNTWESDQAAVKQTGVTTGRDANGYFMNFAAGDSLTLSPSQAADLNTFTVRLWFKTDVTDKAMFLFSDLAYDTANNQNPQLTGSMGAYLYSNQQNRGNSNRVTSATAAWLSELVPGNGNRQQPKYDITTAQWSSNSAPAWSDGNWHQWVIAYDANDAMSLYLDDQMLDQAKAKASPMWEWGSGTFVLGGLASPNGGTPQSRYSFEGSMRGVELHDVTWTGDEVRAAYLVGTRSYVPEPATLSLILVGSIFGLRRGRSAR